MQPRDTSAARRLWFWRFGVSIGRYGQRGVYVGLPFLGDARRPRTSRSIGLRWIGVFR